MARRESRGAAEANRLPAARGEMKGQSLRAISKLESSSMPSESETSSVPPFREVVERGLEDDGYEPQSLWLIPVFLRSRVQYYDEAAASIRKRIEEHWEQFGQNTYNSREEFEQSSFVEWIWSDSHPYWWGLNDIVGWIDIRVCVRSRGIQVALFLPTKRVSRRLKDKRYVFRRRETISLSQHATNEQLRESLIEAVETIRNDERIKTRYVDLHQWCRLVRHTDLIGIIREAAEEDLECILAEGGGEN